jgi:hypothetical protein
VLISYRLDEDLSTVNWDKLEPGTYDSIKAHGERLKRKHIEEELQYRILDHFTREHDFIAETATNFVDSIIAAILKETDEK